MHVNRRRLARIRAQSFFTLEIHDVLLTGPLTHTAEKGYGYGTGDGIERSI